MSDVRLVVLVSGAGSNLEALWQAQQRGSLGGAVVAAVGSDRVAAPALKKAAAWGVPTFSVPFRRAENRKRWNQAMAESVAHHAPDWIVLAGFMRLLSEEFVGRWPERIINVHPSLLPAFPGMDGPEQAIAAGVRISGCTVHLVDAGLDSGSILGQAAVPVFPADDHITLHDRIKQQEHQLLPLVISLLAQGALQESYAHCRPELALAVPCPTHAD